MPLYRIHGLAVESGLPLPEALPGPPGVVPQVRVRLGAATPAGTVSHRRPLGPHAWAAPGAVWFRVPGLASFLVTGGQEIVVDSRPGADQDSIRLFLLGPALGALCFQRGMGVLHGNAMAGAGGCLVCVGPPGAGKSTLAAEFMRRGYAVLADDLVPFDSACRALPGIPRLKLLPDAVARLAVRAGELRPIRPGSVKFHYPLGLAFSPDAVPIRWIYVLSWGAGEFRIEPVSGMDRLAPLHEHTYRIGFVLGMGLQGQHLCSSGRLACEARLAVAHLPTGRIGPGEVADRLLADAGMSR